VILAAIPQNVCTNQTFVVAWWFLHVATYDATSIVLSQQVQCNDAQNALSSPDVTNYLGTIFLHSYK
jgi:hypothetical protein